LACVHQCETISINEIPELWPIMELSVANEKTMPGLEETGQQIDTADLMACPDCDMLFKKLHVEPGQVVNCSRCGHTLHAPCSDSVTKTLSLALTGLLLFIPANFMSIMSLNIMGKEGSGSIYDGIIAFNESGYVFVALMVGLTSFFFPFIKLFLLFIISLCLKLKRYPDNLPLLMRWYHHLDEWGMLEVYMVGILVSIIKLYHMAHIHYDTGLFCFVALLIVSLSSSSSMDEHLFWELIEKKPTRFVPNEIKKIEVATL
jgi:paraquat-inducible protein A